MVSCGSALLDGDDWTRPFIEGGEVTTGGVMRTCERWLLSVRLAGVVCGGSACFNEVE